MEHAARAARARLVFDPSLMAVDRPNGYSSIVAMSIERIFTRSGRRGAQVEHARIRLVAGKGIEGDRYFGRDDEPGQNATFIEAEEIEAFQLALRRPIDLSLTGRNIVTRGVRLNDLVGRDFSVGAVRFRGVQLCEPCGGLGRALASADLTPAQVVKRLVHRAGLRADALSTGEIACGEKLEFAV
jgi:MOSC domain-containing protein YiiM